MRVPHSSHFKLLQSHDLDETRALVAGVFNDHKLGYSTVGKTLDYCHQYTSAGALGFSIMGYGAPVRIQTHELESFYLLQLPLLGHDHQINRSGAIHSKAGDATIHSPLDRLTMNWSADCQKLAIRIDRHALERYAMHLAGRDKTAPVHFTNAIDTSMGGGLALKLAAGQIFRNVCKQPDLFTLPMIWSQFEQMVFMNLLTLQPHAFGLANHPAHKAVLPKTVKQAQDYMRANLADPITLETLAQITGTSVRSLHEGFRKHHGESPMRYLRNLRMDQARADLLDPDNPKSITEIAHHWGFLELGRFAHHYRERYGELPSETRKRVG